MRRKKSKRIIKILICLLMITCIFAASFGIIRAVGKYSLHNRTKTEVPKLANLEKTEQPTQQEEEKWQEGWIKYKDRIYAYNQDILTFLFMGIDKNNEVREAQGGTNGGQADALFLLVLNPDDKTIRVIGINRNTMTDIELYNENGDYMTTVTAQIAVQHGFGNGVEESCEYQVKAVRNLLYNLPIHGYCAINMDAVITLTDLIGGIEVTAPEDVKSTLSNTGGNAYVIREGERKLLDGEMAYSYVRYRDIDAAGSADMRLKRQQQFLEEFIKKMKAATLKDISMPVKFYSAVTTHMVTDVTADEIAYLASVAVNYQFDKQKIYSLKGETVMGEQFEEYYVDEDALYEMILEIFYQPVEGNWE